MGVEWRNRKACELVNILFNFCAINLCVSCILNVGVKLVCHGHDHFLCFISFFQGSVDLCLVFFGTKCFARH